MNYSLIKNFAIGFVPIFVFIIVDSIFGTIPGLITAVISGVAYFIFYYWRYRQIEKMIVLDTILIVITGGISILFNNALFFKLKPAVIEMVMTVLVGVHAFSNKPILLNMSKRYMGQISVNDMQIAMMKQLSRVLFVVLLVHTALIIYAAFYWSEGAWAFVSGGLFYILIGLLVLAQLIYFRFIKKPDFPPRVNRLKEMAGEEWFDIVDETGRVIGKATRGQVHGNPALLHPVVHLHIVNDQGQLYLQKRSAHKDLYPGIWDTAVGGHVQSGETITQALTRESREELGITPLAPQPLFRYIMRNSFESELVHVFKMRHNGPFTPNPEEVETGRFFSVFEIKKLLGQGVLTPNFEQEFQLLLQHNFL